jgi:hypothetical protein
MIDGYTYLLMKFKKLVLWMILCKHDLQTQEFSCDLEIVSVNVVEIPWNTPIDQCRKTLIYTHVRTPN